MTAINKVRRLLHHHRKTITFCIAICLSFALAFAMTEPKGAIRGCVVRAECAVDVVDVWREFCAPLIAMVLLVPFVLGTIFAAGWTRGAVSGSMAVGLVWTLFLMMLALGHNPQGVYCDIIQEGPEYLRALELRNDPPCAIQWHAWLRIGFAGWLIGAPLAAAVLCICGFFRNIRRHGFP
jgi:hypothetical protein